jgi:hypothetical protein
MAIPAGFNFKKDAKSDDGPEMQRLLASGHTVAELPAGSYALTSGHCVAPGSLGVLPPGTTYRLNATGGITLVVT